MIATRHSDKIYLGIFLFSLITLVILDLTIFKFIYDILQFVLMENYNTILEAQYNAALVIILGSINNIFYFYYSDNTVRNSCTAEDSPSACITSCSGGRKLDGGYCKCN